MIINFFLALTLHLINTDHRLQHYIGYLLVVFFNNLYKDRYQRKIYHAKYGNYYFYNKQKNFLNRTAIFSFWCRLTKDIAYRVQANDSATKSPTFSNRIFKCTFVGTLFT